MFNILNKTIEKVSTIIPGRKEPSGLTHAYKAGAEWKFVAEDEYEARKGELPPLSFAIRHPFSGFENKAIHLPDLESLAAKITIPEAELKERDLKSSTSDEKFAPDEIIYSSVAKINGKEQRINISKDEAFESGSPLVMNPLIYYRVNSPAFDIAKLPAINLTKFYNQSALEEEQIKFSVKKISVGQAAKSYIDQISNE